MNIATTLRATAAAVILIALAAANPGLAQHDREHEHHDHDAHQDAHGHDAGGPELGMTAAWVRLVDEEEDALGVHAHLTKRLAGEGSWALVTAGVGGEVIFAEARHYVASVVVGVNPWRALTLSVAPGIQWAKHEHEDEVEYETGFVAHLEATWAFAVGSGDIGPTIGWSRAGDEQHWGFGIHFGIHF